MWWPLTAPFVLLASLLSYHWLFQYWYQQRTKGDRYFSLTIKQRIAFQRCLKLHGIILLPFYRFMANGIKEKKISTFTCNNIAFPTAITSVELVNQSRQYPASTDDIFVVTFMKSGTTWLQNCVLHILHHGEVHFDDDHYRHLYAISPWLECSPNASVSIEDAPLLSRYKKRIIKSHLPAQLCPYNAQAKYLYLSREPVSTFQSCVHFFQKMSGPFCPSNQQLLDLFCSDQMLWGSWPEHTRQWASMAKQYNNVLFLHYDDLLNDNIRTLERIADFLNIKLDNKALQTISQKTQFSEMKASADYFDMAPPNIFSVNSSLSFFNQKKMSLTAIDEEKIRRYCNVKP